MSRRNKTFSEGKDSQFLKTMHSGFNYFHQIDFQTTPKKHRKRAFTMAAVDSEDHYALQLLLTSNKQKFSRIHRQLYQQRDNELNDYVKKSLKYQQILNINDNKKKRLPTLNSKIGEIVKKSVTETTLKNVQYQMTTTEYKNDGWKPESREGHTTTVYKNMAVIIGGHCSFPFCVGQVYSFETQTWIKQFQVSSARSYHSAVLYKSRYIIIFGGMGSYDISRKCRVCYNSINLIDLQNYTSRLLKMSNEEIIQSRRCHGCALMGKYMLVFGGINTKREFLKDFVYLDLKELRWYHKQFKIEGKQLADEIQFGLAKHKIVSHFKSSHKSLPLYSSEYTDYQGIYLIGGLFGNERQNIILFIGFNTYNPFIKKVQYSGIPPCSLDPVAQKCGQNNIVIISGDITDRSVKLFKIKEKQFVGIYKYITPPFFGGIGSSLTNYNDEMYVFFGMSDNGYIGGVHSFKINEKIIQNQAKKKKQRHIETDMFWRYHQQILSDSSNQQH